MATGAAIFSAAVGAGSAVDQSNKQSAAAAGMQRAAIENAQQLAASGNAAQTSILRQQNKAIRSAASGTARAEDLMSPFIKPGETAFRQANRGILSVADIRGPLARYIKGGAMDAANSAPFAELLNSQPVQNAARGQANIIKSGFTPAFRQQQLAAAQGGLAAAGDVARIQQRGFDRIGDIVSSGASQRASALIGQTPGLVQLASGAEEAKLLAGIAGQQGNAAAIESLAGLAGTLMGPK